MLEVLVAELDAGREELILLVAGRSTAREIRAAADPAGELDEPARAAQPTARSELRTI